jgi:hypothetical protein
MRTIVYLVTAVGLLAGVAATAGAGNGQSCPTNRTFEQASRDGALPAVYATLHGGATPRSSFLDCSPTR